MTDQAALEPQAASKTLLVDAYACDDHGDGPSYARVTLTPALIDRLMSLREVVKNSELVTATVYGAPDSWGPTGIEDDLRLTAAEMVVGSTGFWFTDRPKHCDYTIEMRAVSFAQLDEALASLDAIVVLSDDPHYTREQYDEDVDAAAEAEAVA